MLLVSIHQFDPDPVIVNVNKLKSYRLLDESTLRDIPSPSVTKTAIKAMPITIEDESSPTLATQVNRLDWSMLGQTVPPFL